MSRVHPDAILAYHAIEIIAMERGLYQHCVNSDLRTLGDRVGVADAKRMSRCVKRAEEAGIVVVLDRGWPDRLGIKGAPAIYCLVGDGETLEAAAAHGMARDIYRNRAAKRQPAGKLAPQRQLTSPRQREQTHVLLFGDIPHLASSPLSYSV